MLAAGKTRQSRGRLLKLMRSHSNERPLNEMNELATKKKYREFKLPDWVMRRVVTPITFAAVFVGGAFFQFSFPFFEKPETAVVFNSATLTANEQWQIDRYTCESMRKIYDIVEGETADPQEVLALARVEQKATGLLLKQWNDYTQDKKVKDDWHENAANVWSNVIALTESYPFRTEPRVAETYPRVVNVDDFKTYLTFGIEAPDDDRLVHWMVVLKQCVFDKPEPPVVAPTVKKAASDERYCPIFRDYKKLNFNRPQLAAVWAQDNLRTVSQIGLQSNQWTQLESSMTSLLGNFTDVQLTMPSQRQVDAFREKPALQILTNRLDLFCGV